MKRFNLELGDYDFEDSGGLFVFQTVDAHQYFILIDETCITHYHIAHEIQHFIDDINTHMGLQESEQRAYLNGYVSQEIHRFLKLKGIKVE